VFYRGQYRFLTPQTREFQQCFWAAPHLSSCDAWHENRRIFFSCPMLRNRIVEGRCSNERAAQRAGEIYWTGGATCFFRSTVNRHRKKSGFGAALRGPNIRVDSPFRHGQRKIRRGRCFAGPGGAKNSRGAGETARKPLAWCLDGRPGRLVAPGNFAQTPENQIGFFWEIAPSKAAVNQCGGSAAHKFPAKPDRFFFCVQFIKLSLLSETHSPP